MTRTKLGIGNNVATDKLHILVVRPYFNMGLHYTKESRHL